MNKENNSFYNVLEIGPFSSKYLVTPIIEIRSGVWYLYSLSFLHFNQKNYKLLKT